MHDFRVGGSVALRHVAILVGGPVVRVIDADRIIVKGETGLGDEGRRTEEQSATVRPGP